MIDPLKPAPGVLATIECTHDLAHGGREGDDASSYTMLVPKGWARATMFSRVTSGLGIPEPLGAFLLHPSAQSPALLVSRTRFAVEIGVEDYLRHRSASEGWSVRDVRWTRGLYGPRLQLVAERGRGEVELRVTTAIADNARLFLVDAVSQARWSLQLHELVWPCGLSFGLDAPGGVERLGRTRVIDAGGLRFELPAEWRTTSKGPGRASAVLERRGGFLAWLGVRLRAQADVADIAAHTRRVRSRIAVGGAVVERSLPTEDPRDHGLAIPGWAYTCEHDARRGQERLVGRSGLRNLEGGAVEIVCVGPSLRDDASGWLRAKRSFELAALTLARRVDATCPRGPQDR